MARQREPFYSKNFGNNSQVRLGTLHSVAAVSHGYLFFTAHDEDGSRIWSTDGTLANTGKVLGLYLPREVTVSNGLVYATVFDTNFTYNWESFM